MKQHLELAELTIIEVKTLILYLEESGYFLFPIVAGLTLVLRAASFDVKNTRKCLRETVCVNMWRSNKTLRIIDVNHKGLFTIHNRDLKTCLLGEVN